VLRNCDSSTVLLSALPHFALKGSRPSLRILSYFWFDFVEGWFGYGLLIWLWVRVVVCKSAQPGGGGNGSVHNYTRRACPGLLPRSALRASAGVQAYTARGCYCQVTTGTDWCSVFINKAGGITVVRAFGALSHSKKRKSFKCNPKIFYS